jgi:NAD(P)-dependent dehydrogenase (short-subunit alcohol dehydrogenase family)
MNTLIISHLGLKRDDLHGETIIVTGGGGGIGYEAAHALLWLGANVIIAEINETIGKHAAEVLSEEFDPESVCFVRTDVGD